MASLSDDFCVITHPEGTDRFIRAVLEVPIHGMQEPFVWGVWVSLSEQSFDRYRETFDAPVEGDGFFGWVCNRIAVYPHDGSRPSDVYVQLDGMRPKVLLHRSETDTDPLVLDQWNGISVARAQELAEMARHEASQETPLK